MSLHYDIILYVMHRVPPPYLRRSPDAVWGMFSWFTMVTSPPGDSRGPGSATAHHSPSRRGRGLRHLCNKQDNEWVITSLSDDLDCLSLWWPISQWTQGRSRTLSSAGTPGSPRSPSASPPSPPGRGSTCSGYRDCCSASGPAPWIASSCWSQSWGAWWGSGAWCPPSRASAGTPRWAESAGSAGTWRTRHLETQPLQHLNLLSDSNIKSFQILRSATRSYHAMHNQWVKNRKINWQIPFITSQW